MEDQNKSVNDIVDTKKIDSSNQSSNDAKTSLCAESSPCGKFASKAGILIIVSVFIVFLSIYFYQKKTGVSIFPDIKEGMKEKELTDIKAFESEEEFKEYLNNMPASAPSYGIGAGEFVTQDISLDEEGQAFAPGANVRTKTETGASPFEMQPQRISETNVQVQGIDEPDILKTDGKEIYYASTPFFQPWEPVIQPMPMQGKMPLQENQDMIVPPQPSNPAEVKLISAFPPDSLGLDSTIDKYGELLLKDSTLIVFSNNEIYGYNVQDPKKPERIWNAELKNNHTLVSSRLFDGKIYIVARSNIKRSNPCPIEPLKIGEENVTLKCSDVYHPSAHVFTDSTYSIMVLNPESGSVEKYTSFIGSSGNSLVYMSADALYITYAYNENPITYFKDFIKEKADDLFPDDVKDRLSNLEKLAISDQAKMTEFQLILSEFENSLDGDERMKLENETTNRMQDFQKSHMREHEKTGIVKISNSDLKIESSGTVPGIPLNQFSLDEYDDTLRIAVTVGSNRQFFGGFGRIRNEDTANDVYVLDDNLSIKGKIQDLGISERIYSVRFIDDKGYVVTFKQTDPFYVLDLSDPKNPEKKGELKIPGFSSYLHPLSKDQILGIGNESGQVKLSLFDVSDPKDPKESDKYLLSETWTEVSENHHAFLIDGEHSVFFLPGGKGGYIFGYSNDTFELKKAVDQLQAKRALYLDNFLYVVGDEKITIFDENSWEKVKEFEHSDVDRPMPVQRPNENPSGPPIEIQKN